MYREAEKKEKSTKKDWAIEFIKRTKRKRCKNEKKWKKKMFRRDIERLKKMENLNNNNKKRMNKRKYQLKKTQENGKRKQG